MARCYTFVGKKSGATARLLVTAPQGSTVKVAKKTITFENLLNPSNFSLSNVTESGGVYTFATGVTAMMNQTLPTPIVGHKYYGRCYQLANSGFSCLDGRFEYFGGDGTGKNIVFTSAGSATTDGQWHIYSSIQSFPSLSGSDWKLRSFTVNGTTTFQRKEHLIVDLTDAFGVGNEPSKEWCDANIPYFTGKYSYLVNPKTLVYQTVSPSEYTQLEYIESNDTQYIDTGVVATNNIGYKVTISNYPSNPDSNIFGARINGSYRHALNVTGDYLGYGYNSYVATSYVLDNVGIHTYSLNFNNDKKLLVDTTQVTTLTSSTFSVGGTLHAFAQAVYNSDGSLYGDNKFSYRIHACTITDGTEIVRNFIPVQRVSDGKNGLYDTIAGQFYTDANGGNFIAGAEVPQYYYVGQLDEYGEWTVNATKGSDSAYGAVEVVEATDIHLELEYVFLFTNATFQAGTFYNVTPTFLYGQIDGTDGFSIKGRPSTNGIVNLHKWGYQIDFTYYTTLKFYAKKVADHGNVRAWVADNPSEDPMTGYHISVRYPDLDTGWHEYSMDVSGLTGIHYLFFMGGYSDTTGNTTSETQYCNIRLFSER